MYYLVPKLLEFKAYMELMTNFVLMPYLVPWITCVHGLYGTHDLHCAHGLPCPMNSLCSRPTGGSWLTLWPCHMNSLCSWPIWCSWLTYNSPVIVAYLAPWILCIHGLTGANGLPCPMHSLCSWFTWSSRLILWSWLTLSHVHGSHGVHDLPCAHALHCPMNSLCSWLAWSSWFTLWHGLPCPMNSLCLKVLSSEMDPAEIRLIR